MNQLTQSLAECCRQHLLDEKWLLAPTLRVGHQWLENVARSGQPVVNARVMSVKSMAVDLASPELAARHITLASVRASAMLVDQALRMLNRDQGLQYLQQLAPSAGVSQAVATSVESLRLAGLATSDLHRDRFEVPGKSNDLARIIDTYLELLQANNLVDYADVLQLAIAQLGTSSAVLRNDTLVLRPDLELQGLERRLLDAVPTGQVQRLAVDQLADPTRPAVPASSDRERLGWLLAPDQAPVPCGDNTVRIVRAVGEVNESQRRHIEVPFEVCLPPVQNEPAIPKVLRGVIDLAFSEPKGWVLVDYKTDTAARNQLEMLVAHYRPQVELYAKVWHDSIGELVCETGLLFTAINTYVVLPPLRF